MIAKCRLFLANMFVIVLLLVSLPENTRAQSLIDMLGNHMQENNNQLNQYMQQQGSLIQQNQQQLVQQAMQNPEVQQRYQQYLASGGRASFAEYAYYYSASAGFSSQGVARYNQQTQDLANTNRQALQQYNDGQFNAMNQIQQSRDESFHNQAQDRGNALMGTRDYVDPSTGESFKLSDSIERRSYSYDEQEDELFYRDNSDTQYRKDSSGYWNELAEDD